MMNELVGTWRLVSWELRDEAGQVSHPLGRAARGMLMYTADGHLAVTVMRPARKRFASDDILDGAVEERAAAVDGYLTYCGTYSYQPGTVTHRVELSLFPIPNWVGTEQLRFAQLEGDRLTLSTAPSPAQGRRQVARPVWERVRG